MPLIDLFDEGLEMYFWLLLFFFQFEIGFPRNFNSRNMFDRWTLMGGSAAAGNGGMSRICQSGLKVGLESCERGFRAVPARFENGFRVIPG